MCYNCLNAYVNPSHFRIKSIQERVAGLITRVKNDLDIDLTGFRKNLLATNRDKLSFTYLGSGNYSYTSSLVWKGDSLLLPTIDGEPFNKYNCILEYAYYEFEEQRIYFLTEGLANG